MSRECVKDDTNELSFQGYVERTHIDPSTA